MRVQVGVVLEYAAGVGLALVAEPKRAAQGDHVTYRPREVAGQSARVDSAEAPADHADRCVVAAMQVVQAVPHAVDRDRGGAEIAAESPTVHPVTEPPQDAPQRPRRIVAP